MKTLSVLPITPVVIGWRERIDLPDWGIRRTRAKIDTGARTSSIDAEVLDLKTLDNGTTMALLGLRLCRSEPLKIMRVNMPVLKTARVRNTNCGAEDRLVVETTMQLGSVTRLIQLTLADRGQMLVPIILGRSALMNDFVVDASRKYILTGRK